MGWVLYSLCGLSERVRAVLSWCEFRQLQLMSVWPTVRNLHQAFIPILQLFESISPKQFLSKIRERRETPRGPIGHHASPSSVSCFIIKVCLPWNRWYIARYRWPSCQFQAGSPLLLSFYSQVSSGQQASYIIAGRFTHLDPEPGLLTNHLDMLIACLISPRRPPEPCFTSSETLPITALVYQGLFLGVPIPLPMTLVV